MAVRPSVAIEMQFSGSAGAWTSVRADVRTDVPVTCNYGIGGNSPNDRVAGTGTLSFALNNAQNNSGGLLGYYSPSAANTRSGFELGIGARLAITYSGSTFYKFSGRLDDIDVLPGKLRGRLTHCVAVDWMDEAAKHKLDKIDTQINQRADQLIATVVGNMKRVPAASSLAQAQMEFPFAMDTANDESTTALEELQRIALSDFGYIFLAGNTSTGGVLTFQDRRTRFNPGSSLVTLNDSMVEMAPPRRRQNLYNRTRVTIHPRRVDPVGTTTVLYSMDGFLAISASQSITIDGQYRDPNQEAARMGGASLVAPVASTDYTFGSDEVAESNNLIANLSASGFTGGNAVRFQFDNDGTQGGFLTKFQVRGRGIFDYAPLTLEATSASSQSTYGLYSANVDMPYEPKDFTAQAIADWILARQKDPIKQVDSVTFVANEDDTLMLAALRREPGDLITITETATGISQDYFIHGVALEATATDILHCAWGLALINDPNLNDYWILGTDTLGTGTRLAL